MKAREHFEEEHGGGELPCIISLKYKKHGSLKVSRWDYGLSHLQTFHPFCSVAVCVACVVVTATAASERVTDALISRSANGD
jgi:hypothetical protein